MRHGIVAAAGLVVTLTLASWIGGRVPADDASAVTPGAPAVVLELVDAPVEPPGRPVDAPADDTTPPAAIAPTTTRAPVAPAPPTDPDPAGDPQPSVDRPAFLAAIDALRSEHGLAPLRGRADLDRLAQSWAADMAAADDLHHSELIYDVIAGVWTTAGENVGYGPSVGVIVDALEASPVHLDNMLNPDFTSVGIGVVWVDDVLWTAHLFAG